VWSRSCSCILCRIRLSASERARGAEVFHCFLYPLFFEHSPSIHQFVSCYLFFQHHKDRVSSVFGRSGGVKRVNYLFTHDLSSTGRDQFSSPTSSRERKKCHGRDRLFNEIYELDDHEMK
jgi:hypothetical protein